MSELHGPQESRSSVPAQVGGLVLPRRLYYGYVPLPPNEKMIVEQNRANGTRLGISQRRGNKGGNRTREMRKGERGHLCRWESQIPVHTGMWVPV